MAQRLTLPASPALPGTGRAPYRRTAPTPVRRTAPAPVRRRPPNPVRRHGARRGGIGGLLAVVVIGAVGYAWSMGGTSSATTGTGGGNGVPATSAQVDQWVSQADQILAQNGEPMTADDNDDIKIIIMHESAGNPRSENTTDINARQGNPSIGLMQTTGTTFAHNCTVGYCADIRDPVSNIVAGTQYAIRRYGSLDNTPGPRSIHAGGSYKPY